jgi:hypothetical protein
VGKTTLLDELGAVAGAAGVACTRLDLHAIEPSPPAFRAALADALDCHGSALDAITQGPRRVLLLDTFETAGPLEPWVRDRFLPALRADTLAVIASRVPPAPEWLADPGWRALLRVVALDNLSPAEAGAYLRAVGVADRLHDRALELTHGHPLALSLLVDVLTQRADSFELFEAPDVVRRLLERFVRDIPSARHRLALEACAHARFTTEDLLRSVIGIEHAGQLFRWLRTLSFIEESELGLFPHDLARDVLDADLRWRAPDCYAALHREIGSHLRDRLRRSVEDASTHGAARAHNEVADLLFLQRSNRVFSRFVDWSTFGRLYGDRLKADDREPILAMAERHEGAESAALVARLLERQPGSFVVFRETEDDVQGFVAILALHDAGDDDLADPGAQAMWE